MKNSQKYIITWGGKDKTKVQEMFAAIKAKIKKIS